MWGLASTENKSCNRLGNCTDFECIPQATHRDCSAKGRSFTGSRCLSVTSDQSLADHKAMMTPVIPGHPSLKIKTRVKKKKEKKWAETSVVVHGWGRGAGNSHHNSSRQVTKLTHNKPKKQQNNPTGSRVATIYYLKCF